MNSSDRASAGASSVADARRGGLRGRGSFYRQRSGFSAIRDLNDDELRDLITLVWLGRSDFTLAEWTAARAAAGDIGWDLARTISPKSLWSVTTLRPEYIAASPTLIGCTILFSGSEFCHVEFHPIILLES